MISRVWHGWTNRENADAYEELLRTEIFLGIAKKSIRGYRGIHLLRRDVDDGVEFVTVKASRFEALYEIMDGDTSLLVDVSTWGASSVAGVNAWNRRWPNRGGGYPAISNVRQWSSDPIPEPSAALVFGLGALIVGSRVRRQS